MGIFFAILIIASWGAHLVYTLFAVNVNFLSINTYVHILLQTYLFTSLFITAHDSMHSSISDNLRINNFLGKVSLVLFAAFSYKKVYSEHIKHHRHPGTDLDPDFDSKSNNFVIWFYHFFIHYVSLLQILFLALIFNFLFYVLDVLPINLIFYWILPALFSTLQLFYFGTFVPHRRPHLIQMKPHNARTQKRNHLWALISCYFFGYHFEHHASPRTPWWGLYKIKNNHTAGLLNEKTAIKPNESGKYDV